MAYNMRGSQFYGKGNSSPIRQTKEIKGTSIFGKSPKELLKTVVDTTPTGRLYRKAKKVYDKYTKKPTIPQHEVVHPTQGAKKMMMKQEFKQLKKKGVKEGTTEAMQQLSKEKMRVLTNKMKPKGKRTITDKTKMKPPYKKPVGPRAEQTPLLMTSPAKQTKFPKSKGEKARVVKKKETAHKKMTETPSFYSKDNPTGQPTEKYMKQVEKYSDAKRKLKTFETPE